ncbi:hypothetical protein D3C76_951220 [compost metagenome]
MLAAVFAVDGVEVELQAEVVGQVAAGSDVAVPQLASAGREGGALLQGGPPFARNRRADEVDHPADVVRAVLHGGAAADDVDAIDGRQGQRKQRKAGLPIRCEGHGNAVGKRLDASAAALVQATHGNLRQGAGAGLVEDLHAGDALQRIIDAAHTAFLQVRFGDYAAATGVGAQRFLAGRRQHIALDDQRRQRAHIVPGLAGEHADIAVGELETQAGTRQQNAQCFLRAVLATQRRRFAAFEQIAGNQQVQATRLAERDQRFAQRPRRNVEAAARLADRNGFAIATVGRLCGKRNGTAESQ